MKQGFFWMPALSAAVTSQAAAQQFVYPTKGQSRDQRQAAFARARAARLEGKGHTVKQRRRRGLSLTYRNSS